MKHIKHQPPITQVVEPERTILDQVLDMPISSLLIVKRVSENTRSFIIDSLLRTGIDGWIATRPENFSATGGSYMNKAMVKRWIEHYTSGAYDYKHEFYLVDREDLP